MVQAGHAEASGTRSGQVDVLAVPTDAWSPAQRRPHLPGRVPTTVSSHPVRDFFPNLVGKELQLGVTLMCEAPTVGDPAPRLFCTSLGPRLAHVLRPFSQWASPLPTSKESPTLWAQTGSSSMCERGTAPPPPALVTPHTLPVVPRLAACASHRPPTVSCGPTTPAAPSPVVTHSAVRRGWPLHPLLFSVSLTTFCSFNFHVDSRIRSPGWGGGEALYPATPPRLLPMVRCSCCPHSGRLPASCSASPLSHLTH